jgi:hypothetical protein
MEAIELPLPSLVLPSVSMFFICGRPLFVASVGLAQEDVRDLQSILFI